MRHTLFAITPLASLACFEPPAEAPPQMQVIHMTGTESDGTGQFALGPVATPTDSTLRPLGDATFRFWSSHDLDASLSQVAAASLTSQYDRRYQPRYQVRNNVAVPLDTESLTMFSAYHAYTTTLAKARELTGLPETDLVPPGGFHVLLNPRIVAGVVTQEPFTNAFYIPHGAYTFGVFRSNEFIEGVPVSSSLPVLAHEFGHHIFNQTFGRADGLCDPKAGNLQRDFPGRLSLRNDISGMNEGFADVFSYLVTGVTSPLADAFVNVPVEDAEANPIGERTLVPEGKQYQPFSIDGNAYVCESFYCIGTLWARAMMQTLRAMGMDTPEGRTAFAQQLVAIMPALPARIKALLPTPSAGTYEVTCDEPAASLFDEAPKLSELAGETTRHYLQAFVEQAPASWRPHLCREFATQFGRFFNAGAEVCL